MFIAANVPLDRKRWFAMASFLRKFLASGRDGLTHLIKNDMGFLVPRNRRLIEKFVKQEVQQTGCSDGKKSAFGRVLQKAH